MDRIEKILSNVVVVSRKWNGPEIRTRVNITDEAIYISVPIDDFVKGIIEELGSVATVFTKKEIEKRLLEAKDKVIKSMKQESRKGV